MNPKDIISTYNNWVVIGVTPDQEKYGYEIFKRLKEISKTVYGINPKYQEIEGNKIYPSLLDIKDNIDVVVMVVNPKIGINYLDEIKDRGVKFIWLQPGTESPEIKEKANNLELEIIEACVLVVSKYIK